MLGDISYIWAYGNASAFDQLGITKEPSTITMNQNTIPTEINQEEVTLVPEEEVEKLKQSLPKVNWMGSEVQLLKIQDFWHLSSRLCNILTFQRHFLAQDTDLIIASFPKTGTTWLKSLLFSVANRSLHSLDQSPLLSNNPHGLVYDLETGVYGGNMNIPSPCQLRDLPSPRLLHSHLPYVSLPESIKTSTCKILYISRNPFDTLVSHWHFYPKAIKKLTGNEDFQPPPIDDFFEDYCQGIGLYGSFFKHVLGYWKQSLEQPDKVLFLMYEDLKENPIFNLKKLAEFIGMPFSSEEEGEGVIQQIIELCSINNLKELEVNNSGSLCKNLDNKSFFRDGEVGGWTRYFTPTMVEKMKKLMEQELGGTGLSYKLEL